MKKEVKKNSVKIDIIVGLIVFVSFFILYLLFAPSKATFFGTWERYVDDYTEVLILGKDGKFSYYDVDAGNPIGMYDLCDSYSYSNGYINLNCSLQAKLLDDTKIKIVSSSEDELVLKFRSGERTFTRRK